jgi:hypothetical protein
MRAFATLGNESHVVVIGTYCHDSTLIATNTVVAKDPISCSGGREKITIVVLSLFLPADTLLLLTGEKPKVIFFTRIPISFGNLAYLLQFVLGYHTYEV